MKKIISLLLLAVLAAGCKHEEKSTAAAYPEAVEKIMTSSCATAGCHNEISSAAAGGLDLTDWESLQKGAYNGSVVIPYRPDYSTLLYFTNTDSALGISQQPTMPINGTPLTAAEYQTLKDWINAGAPSAQGETMFPADPARHKFYVTCQGCDVVYVFDADKRVAIRAVDVGIVNGGPSEAPHSVRVTPDGKYWVVCFLKSDVIQVFDATTDLLVKTIPIDGGIAGGGNWNTLTVSADSKKVFVCDYAGGYISEVDIESGTCNVMGFFAVSGSNQAKLHGTALNADESALYATCQDLSILIRIPLDDVSNYSEVKLYKGAQPSPVLRPHQLVFSPDHSKYFVTCAGSNEVRVMDASKDTLIKIISTGILPLEMSISPSKGLLFVTNEEDNTYTDMKGSVSVIDINTLTEVKKIKVGWQPHGICVDEKEGLVYVPNRNVSAGVAPHHASVCGGANGSLSVIDLNTLETLTDYKPELSVDAYSVWVKP